MVYNSYYCTVLLLSTTILDGKTNRYEAHLPYAAPALKAAGVQVYSVGIGNIDIAELQLISSDPDDEHVFILSSFRDAAGFVDFLSVTTCESESHGITKFNF